MEPWLLTPAVLVPENFRRPAIKSVSLIFNVDATMPPTLTCAPGANITPLGLTRNTRPLAFRLPRIFDGSEPTTRLSVTALTLGCLKLTVSPAPMLKPCQLMAAFWLPCVIVVTPGALAMLDCPAETTPPVGAACAVDAKAHHNAADSGVNAKRARADADRPPAVFLPLPEAISEAATKVPSVAFQMER